MFSFSSPSFLLELKLSKLLSKQSALKWVMYARPRLQFCRNALRSLLSNKQTKFSCFTLLFCGRQLACIPRRTCRTIILFINLLFNLFSDGLITVALCFNKTKLIFVDILVHTGDVSLQHFTNKFFCSFFTCVHVVILSLLHFPWVWTTHHFVAATLQSCSLLPFESTAPQGPKALSLNKCSV